MDLVRENILASMRRGLGATGERGAACLLRGAAGMGKTFLAEQFLNELPRDTAALVSSVPPTGTPPLMPICQALVSDTRKHVIEEVSAAVERHSRASPILHDTLVPMLKDLGVELRAEALVREVAPPETYTFWVLSDALRRVGSRQRTVLFIDDIQWLDESSTKFLGFLSAQLTTVPIFVLLSARTNGKEPPGLSLLRTTLSRTGEQGFVDCSLPPLSADEATLVSERFLRGPLSCTAAESEWLRRTSKGIPIYLKEVLALLRDQGDIALSEGAWRFTRAPESLVLPTSFYTMTLERLRALIPDIPEVEVVLHVAAVCGTEFDVRLLSRVVAPMIERSEDFTAQRVKSVLERVASATGFVRRRETASEWAFDHDLTREAIVDDLGDLRREVHAKVAEALAQDEKAHPGTVAHHFCEAGAWQRAAEYFGRAAEDAAQCFSFEQAVAAAQRREQMLIQGGFAASAVERLEAAELVGRCLLSAQHYDQAADYLSKLHRAGLTKGRPRLLHGLAQAKLNLLDAASHEEAVEILRMMSRQLAWTGDVAALHVEADLILAQEAVGNRQGSQAAYRRTFALAEAAEDPYWQIRVRRLACIFWPPQKAMLFTEQALEMARSHKLHFQEALCLNNLGTQRLYLHDLDLARAHFERSRDVLSSCGGYREEVPANNLGLIALVEGRLDQALTLFREALAVTLALDDRLFIRANEAITLAMMGKLDIAIDSLFDAAKLADDGGDVFYQDCVRYNLARALLLRGEPQRAVDELTACPPRRWINDDALIVAKRAGLLMDAYSSLGRAPEPEWIQQRSVLDRVERPRAWLYQYPWELCGIQFWED